MNETQLLHDWSAGHRPGSALWNGSAGLRYGSFQNRLQCASTPASEPGRGGARRSGPILFA